jgi:hypothetical protein
MISPPVSSRRSCAAFKVSFIRPVFLIVAAYAYKPKGLGFRPAIYTRTKTRTKYYTPMRLINVSRRELTVVINRAAAL